MSPRPGTLPAPSQRMFADDPPDAVQNAGGATLGSHFRATAAGEVTHVRWWHVPGCGGRDHQPTVWDYPTRTVLATVPGAPPSALDGWYEAALAAPLVLVAGGEYVTSYTVSGNQGIGALRASLAPDLQLLEGGWGGGYTFPTNMGASSVYADVVFIGPGEPAKGSRLIRSRRAIADALDAGGVRVAFTGQFTAPCVIIEAGDPWGAVDLSMGRRRVARWKLTAVAGRADSEAALEGLAELVDTTDRALLTLPGVQLPTWAKPSDAMLAGIPYAATTATIQLITEEDSL